MRLCLGVNTTAHGNHPPDGTTDLHTIAIKQLAACTVKDASARQISSTLQWMRLNLNEPDKNGVAKLLTGMLQDKFEGELRLKREATLC